MSREIKLVRGITQPCSVLLFELHAEFFHGVNYFRGGVPVKWDKRLEAVPEFGQTNRHGADALNRRVKRTQIFKGLFKLLAIVKSGAKHELGIELYTGFCKTVHGLQRLTGKTVVHHSAAKLGIGGVNRDVDRTYVHIYNSLNFMLGQIGQCNIVSEKEGKPGIIVLEI